MTKRVLIVEDEIFVALEIEDIVTSAGLSVSAIAVDSAAALEAASDSDIALVDLNLRDGPTGPSIGQALSQQYGIKVIYVTANPSQIGGAAVAALGVITKPFRSGTIKAALALAANDVDQDDDGELDYRDIAGFTPFLPRRGSASGTGYTG
ncbi:MAG: response regulator [Sphingobium sp.]|uniref:response regulator n=1 Tax=Sphingobium sp. TaxID=1912891 RepID=UPI0029B54DAE|nr:response regulator [Sphingobium sp.]MDX3909888.1 response regulator [Sphingobium sp.]